MDHDELTQQEELDLEEIMRLIDMNPEEPKEQSTQEEPAPEILAPQEEPPVEVPSAEPAKHHRSKEANSQKNAVLYLHDLAYLMGSIVLIFLLCFRIVIVSGDSMFNTLWDGDYLLLLSNVFYSEPQQGDIIVASKQSYENGTPIIKRVIATEGQTVNIDFKAGIVYVDGVALEEDYIYTQTTLDEGVSFPLVVDDGCVFVLGDNRGVSKDSRNPQIGLIDTRQIVGKAIFLIFPGTDEGAADRQFDRIGVIG